MVYNLISAVREKDVLGARIYIIARHYMLRVANQLLPLQANGPAISKQWHCQVLSQGDAVTIRLRTRKNAPSGATITRHCACTQAPSLLCGP